jgi:hypothetical protein
MLYRTIGFILDFIRGLVCGRQKDYNVSETGSVEDKKTTTFWRLDLCPKHCGLFVFHILDNG